MGKPKKELSASEIIKQRRYKIAVKREYKSLFLKVLLLVAIGYVLFKHVFLIKHVNGMEMFPAVKDGDLLLGYRLVQEFEEEDIIIYQHNGKEKIGRIIAREQDVVMLSDSGTLTVNGTIQDEEVLYLTYAKEGMGYPYLVSEGCVFVLGDYRTQAEDSRDFGEISLEQIEGKVITLLRRRGL